MAGERRRLVAIVAADVVGSSRLMAEDEVAALAAIARLRREVLEPRIAAHEGRLFKAMGDGFLAEFRSAVEALRCALSIQEALCSGGLGVAMRIGVHQGDVVVAEDGSDLLGDGVNVAARLEGLAEPGGVAVSWRVREDAEGKLDVHFEDLGERELRNIPRPVRVFRAQCGGMTRAVEPPGPPRLPLPDRPSLAVLPFQNMGGGPEQDYFADGMVEEITTALSRIPWLFVVARNSAFTYKGRAVDVREVGRQLGVRYVLEGSVRRAGGRVRITGQLVEAEAGRHVWADRFDGALDDVFDLQDRVAEAVVGAVAPRLETAEVARAGRKRPENLDAWDLVLRALPGIHGMTRAGIEQAVGLLARAVVLDPGYAAALGLAAWCHTLRVAQLWAASPDDTGEGLDLARRAIAAGAGDSDALATGGYALGFLGRDPAAGLPAIDRGLALAPSSARGFTFSGWMRAFAGEHEAALEHFARALRLSPLDPMAYRTRAGEAFAHLFAGRPQRAVEVGWLALRQQPNFTPTHRTLIAALGHLGRREEAGVVVRQALAATPGLTVSSAVAAARFVQPRDREVFATGLRLGGLPG